MAMKSKFNSFLLVLARLFMEYVENYYHMAMTIIKDFFHEF